MAQRDESDGGQRYPGEVSGLLGALPLFLLGRRRSRAGAGGVGGTCWCEGQSPGASRAGGSSLSSEGPAGAALAAATDLPGCGLLKKLRGAGGLSRWSVHRVA